MFQRAIARKFNVLLGARADRGPNASFTINVLKELAFKRINCLKRFSPCLTSQTSEEESTRQWTDTCVHYKVSIDPWAV